MRKIGHLYEQVVYLISATQERRRQSSRCCVEPGVRSIGNKTRPQHVRNAPLLRRMEKGW